MVELIDHVSEHSVLMPSKKHELKERKRKHDFNWYLGVFFILIVAIIWTFSSVLVQYIFHNLSFQGPFFLTYMGISLFSLNLPLYYLGQVVWPRIYTWYTNRKNVMKGYAFPTIPDFENEVKKKQKQKASYYEIAKISALISPLWFIANFTYNQSLNMTTVTSSTIISSTSTVFTFLLSVCLLKEKFVWLKLFGVLFCMAGNITTIFKDSHKDSLSSEEYPTSMNYVFGDFVAFFAAFMYGVYTTAIQKLIPNEESVSISLFFGFLGMINFVCLMPFILLFHYTGIESLGNLTTELVFLMSLKGLFDNVLADYLWARAILLTSPTVATVGLSLTVPFAILSDYIFHGTTPNIVTILASSLVILGFMLINVSTKRHKLQSRLSSD